MIFIYITTKNKKEAEKIALHLLKNRFAACINFFPVNSFYLWKGKIEKSKEFVCIIKTNKSFEKVKEEIKKLHSYKIPCICKINIKADSEFKSWIKKELR